MALFNKESEKSVRPQEPPKPQAQPVQAASPSPQPQPPPPRPEERPASSPRPNGPVAQSVGSAADGRAYLDKGCKISGKLFFEGPTRVDGQVDGEIGGNDTVTIGESAVVTAQIKATSVVIAGKVSGDVTASKRIEIRPSAKVLGNITTPVLVVHEGALFEGHCAMQSEGGKDQRTITLFPKEERRAQAEGSKPA